jgi:hypothetical protein
MGFIEDTIKEIESEKINFLKELDERILRLKEEGHIGHPNHLHFTVGGDISFKVLMIYVLNTRGLNIQYEGKKLGSKFVADCSEKAYEEVIVFTLDSLGPIVYDKYQALTEKFWGSMYEMFGKKEKE